MEAQCRVTTGQDQRLTVEVAIGLRKYVTAPRWSVVVARPALSVIALASMVRSLVVAGLLYLPCASRAASVPRLFTAE